MARFDKSDVKRITEYFESIGYPVIFLNANDESGEWKQDERGFNHKYFNSPITIKGVQRNDEWNIFTRDGISIYGFNRYFNVVDGKIALTNYAQDAIRLELVDAGSKFLNEQEIDLTEYEGRNEFANFEKFDDIDAPDYSSIYGDDPQVSVATPPVDIEELTASQIKKAQEKLEASKKALAELKEAERTGDIATAMWTFDEVDELYNSKITADDKRAYFIYLQNKCGKKLGGDWGEKYGSSYPAQATDILELMKKGALFYDPTAKLGERLQPKVIYKSGNIWKKWGSLTNKKEEIVKRFGEDIYLLHFQTLEPIWTEVNKNRLGVRTEDKSMRLTLLPISSLAEDIKIEGIVSPRDKATIEKNFQVYTSFKKGERVEDLIGTEGGTARLNFINKKVISLYEGFLLWCKDAGSGLQSAEYGIQWSSITTSVSELKDYYLRPISNPFSKEKNSEERWARYKDDARKVGERLFAQFLAEGLTPEDQMKVEYIWNSIYNAYVEPNLEEVPIGFTYKKYLDNRHLFVLKDSNLRAIRYYLTRGSIGLAYGVGLGKTFCSIFAMKQALDLGTAVRPLVIVPNQVYFQFGEEIKRGLGSDFDASQPNSRLNMFYNGGGIYNQLGNNAVDGINLCTYEATEAFQFAKENLDYSWVEEAVSIIEMGGEIKSEPIVEGFLKAHSKGLFNEETIEFDSDYSDEYQEESPAEIEPNNEDFSDDDDLGGFKEGGKVPRPKKQVEPIIINSEFTNFDMVVVDEAHNFNNLFTAVVAEPKKIQTGNKDKKSGKIKVQREKNPYSSIRETSGGKDASARAEKLWFIARFIQHYNKMGNTILLSATPFTNSPLQIYSMLSYLNYDMLYDAELGIIKDFFDTYAKIEYTDDFRTDLTIVKRNKFVGWTNLISLQKYVYRVFDKSSREEEDKAVVRPNKWVLPLKRIMIDGKLVEFAKENFISTTIRMSDLQLELWKNVRKYAQGELTYEDLCNEQMRNETSFGKYVAKVKKSVETDSEDGSAEVDIEDADNLTDGTQEGEKAKATAKALQCLMWGRQIALNPYLFKCSGFKQEPTARMYVEQSPKLLYTMECIKAIKEYTEANNIGYTDYSVKGQPREVKGMSGQVIYMNFGTKAFELLRDYLVDVIGFNIDEIGIIRGDGNYIGKKRYDNKQAVADAFLGRVRDAETGKYTFLPNEKRVKVLIGSESIKEGINLQDYASVLYNCFLDFNPTDMVQVEGRIWRQGNALKNVRIVTPLMADCIDIFMFQKLEDKTERINQIWTKNGNSNELDTTAFNPAELKYELLTDPVAIANLEREYKKDKIEEQKTQEGEILSGYLAIESVFKKSLEIKYQPINESIKEDFRFRMHYNISQLRPDLIDKPLLNQEYFPTFLKAVYEENTERFSRYAKDYETLLSECKNIYGFVQNYITLVPYESPYKVTYPKVSNPLYRMQFDKLFNYSVEDLINLMVKVLKDQKIAYPLGYSKNWRELIPAKEIPIIEGDEVEFDTKKGRKKGVAELVSNRDGRIIVRKFWDKISRYMFLGSPKESYLKESLKKAEIKETDLFDYNNNQKDFETLDKKDLDNLIKFLKWMYLNDTEEFVLTSDGEITQEFIPTSLDVDEFEDLSIESKNITKVQKQVKEKRVEPTKNPEPFVWSNKDRNENIKDISEYIGTMLLPNLPNDLKGTQYQNYVVAYANMNPNEMIPQGSDEIYSLPQIVSLNSSSWDAFEFKSKSFDNLKDSWAILVEAWKDTDRGGMFKTYYKRFYSVDLPLTLAEFKTIEQKKMQPLGINTFQDVENLINAQKTKINTLTLESKNLDDEQVFQELVEEVVRRIEALNSEEIRLGSSISSRVASFATPNSDYLGNEMLSLFVPQESEEGQEKQPKKKVVKQIEKPKEEVVEKVEVEEVVTTKSTQELIDELLMLSEFETDEAEKQKTIEIAEALKLTLMFE